MNTVWKDRKRTLFGLPWSFTVYELTDEVLYIRRGLFTTTEDEVRLYRILDVSLKQTLGQKIFGVGTIHCCSADKSMGDFDILSVKKSKDVKRMLSEMVEKERERKRVTNREYMIMDDEDHDVL